MLENIKPICVTRVRKKIKARVNITNLLVFSFLHSIIGDYYGLKKIKALDAIAKKKTGHEGFEPSISGIKVLCLDRLNECPNYSFYYSTCFSCEKK